MNVSTGNRVKEKSEEHFNETAAFYDKSFDGKYVSHMYKDLLEIMKGRETGIILDVGCGTDNVLLSLVNGKRKLYGIDLSDAVVEIAKKRLENQAEIHIADAEKLPFPEGKFDIIICNASFHHYPHPEKVLEEMRRVLKPHGVLIIGEGSYELYDETENKLNPKTKKKCKNVIKPLNIVKNFGLFEISVVLFFYIFPILSILLEGFYLREPGMMSFSEITFKWVVFWGIGMRLFTCGIKQIIQPQFTANTIFSVVDEKAYPLVRELGFANLCFGLGGLLSIIFKEFRAAAAFLGLLYYCLAFFQHLSNRNKNTTELFVTVTDFSIVIEILTCVLLISQ